MKKTKIIFEIAKEQEQLNARYQSHDQLVDRKLLQDVLTIYDEVSALGDEAIRKRTSKHDGVHVENILLSDDYVVECVAAISPALRAAIEQAINHVKEVNTALLPVSWEREIRAGTIIGEKVSPLDAVGIWIPARKGPLLSTAIMLVTAAKVAGVKRIIVGMPPLADGTADGGTVAAAKLAGADQFVIGNGVAIIAGLAQGTASIPEVDGIYGPGPNAIAAAMSIAMTYGKKSSLGLGPTESLIVADHTANPQQIVYDLMNEAEHGADSSAILVTTSKELANQVEALLWPMILTVEGERQQYLQEVFSERGKGAIIVAATLNEACTFINWFAPEHVLVIGDGRLEAEVMQQVKHAGEILIGNDTPFSAANYGIGITAVLPTNRFAKSFSGVTVKDMIKYSTIGKLDKHALANIYPIIEQLGYYERLPCHVQAAAFRLS